MGSAKTHSLRLEKICCFLGVWSVFSPQRQQDRSQSLSAPSGRMQRATRSPAYGHSHGPRRPRKLDADKWECLGQLLGQWGASGCAGSWGTAVCPAIWEVSGVVGCVALRDQDPSGPVQSGRLTHGHIGRWFPHHSASPDICSPSPLARHIPDDKKVSQEKEGRLWPGDGLQVSGQLAPPRLAGDT